jgi:hypothetical protein
MINNYNANLDTRANRELLNQIYRIQLIKDEFYVPSNIQPNMFRHDLLFGRTKEGEGSVRSQSQFNLPVGDMRGYAVGGALRSDGHLVSHELNYLVDEMERGHPLRSTPFLGKRGEYSESTGLVRRTMSGAGIKRFSKNVGDGLKDVGQAIVINPTPSPDPNARSASQIQAQQNKQSQGGKIKRVKSSPMKKLKGQFSILNKVI